jgi:hypothetical protein
MDVHKTYSRTADVIPAITPPCGGWDQFRKEVETSLRSESRKWGLNDAAFRRLWWDLRRLVHEGYYTTGSPLQKRFLRELAGLLDTLELRERRRRAHGGGSK